MPSSLKAKLFAAASLNAGLVALLGSGSPLVMRWFDQQLPQSYATFPAVVVQQIANPSDYAVTGRLPTSWSRMQFTVYGSGADSENANAVVVALAGFLDTFNSIGITGLVAYPNLIVGDRDFGVANTQPLTYVRVIDARIFSNSNL